ncbi:hypothetical protein QLL95_gp1089 [Cotonvirus japonicus]|uniref:Transmembrane protein n=1 Tax=Cotonvirus japonicus TaxID=2811091 RepID=A0ABM7NS94_9VIRU|nr:hypothetical protein QLL95_gp1089 [Cotonvirus japonicus]BCS83034.1 hypothetical protein [Cotonvirus japonicus]
MFTIESITPFSYLIFSNEQISINLLRISELDKGENLNEAHLDCNAILILSISLQIKQKRVVVLFFSIVCLNIPCASTVIESISSNITNLNISLTFSGKKILLRFDTKFFILVLTVSIPLSFEAFNSKIMQFIYLP